MKPKKTMSGSSAFSESSLNPVVCTFSWKACQRNNGPTSLTCPSVKRGLMHVHGCMPILAVKTRPTTLHRGHNLQRRRLQFCLQTRLAGLTYKTTTCRTMAKTHHMIKRWLSQAARQLKREFNPSSPRRHWAPLSKQLPICTSAFKIQVGMTNLLGVHCNTTPSFPRSAKLQADRPKRFWMHISAIPLLVNTHGNN